MKRLGQLAAVGLLATLGSTAWDAAAEAAGAPDAPSTSFAPFAPLATLATLATYTVEGRRSGFTYLGSDNQALQQDAFANPGMLWVDRGARLWTQAPAPPARSCAECHGAPETLRGAAARLPAWNPRRQQLENLELRINACRTERQGAPAWAWESEPLLAMTALVSHQSRGLPVDVAVDGPAAPWFASGAAEFQRRRGQLDLSCAHCHERHAGDRLRGDVISQGMVNGFPIYRLTWQTLGSRQRMLRWCNESVRAEPHAWGSDAYLALELYLAWRARGLPIETPAIRR